MKGKVVSKGIAIGRVKRIEAYRPVGIVLTEQLQYEKKELVRTKELVVNELDRLVEKTSREVGEKESEIFKAHKMIMLDPTLLPQIECKIEAERLTAASAVEMILNQMEDMFKAMDSEYMQERASDIYDIKKRWVKHLLQTHSKESMDEAVILIAEDLTPSDTLELDLDMIAGLAMEKGGVTSHTAILAQSIGIPAMVGCGDLSLLQAEEKVVLDADSGVICINPSDEEITAYEKKLRLQHENSEALQRYVDMQAITVDGHKMEIGCNIAGLKDIKDVLATGADGVGLFRTEFVYMNRKAAPDEDEQFEIYKRIVEGLEGRPIIFRTMDIGGDKEVDYLKMPKEHNPFLGYRAIRYCLDETDFFKTQLRAIMRTSSISPIKIMFPMIGNIVQFLEVKALVDEVVAALKSEGYTIGKYELGIMIEIPSAAIRAESFAKHVDFFSIGTNDLTQYTLAVDRQNEKIGDLYDYCDPAVLNLIHMVIKAANKTNTWVGMCGSAAGDPLMIPLLTHWGINELSMASSQVLEAKKQINQMKLKNIDELTNEIFEASDHHAVRRLLQSLQ